MPPTEMESGISLYLQSTAHTGYAPSNSQNIESAYAHTAGSTTGAINSPAETEPASTATAENRESAPSNPHRASPIG